MAILGKCAPRSHGSIEPKVWEVSYMKWKELLTPVASMDAEEAEDL